MKAREQDSVIAPRKGNGGQLFIEAMLATTGMNKAAVAVFDMVLPIIIVIETIIITITGKGRYLILIIWSPDSQQGQML